MKIKLLPFFLFFSLALSAQELPSFLTDQEQDILDNGQYFFTTDVPNSSPPPFPPRTMAEWEEIQAIVVTWTQYTATVAEIVRHAKEEVQVIIVCSNASQVQNQLLNIYDLDNLDNISFIETEYDSIWIRDYGPNTIYGYEVDTLGIVDWIYNRPRPDDDVIPIAIADFMDLPIFSTTEAPYQLVHTGGNFTSDGLGTGFSSSLVVDENAPGSTWGAGIDEDEVKMIMEEFMGIDRYIIMPKLPYDGIHHIDMHMRLLDEETILVGEYPEGVSDGPQIEANLQYILNNFNSAFGTPYKVVRIPMPPHNGNYPWNGGNYRTYTNSVLVNNTILVPTYEEQYDTTALRIYREAMPGYNVVGIDCNAIINSLGALHCITRAVGVHDPLWIVHQEHDDVFDYTGDFEISATIKHRSGISDATLYYTTDTLAGYNSTPMTLTDLITDTWTANIPGVTEESQVFYYIEGNANSGKSQVRPLPAPAGYFDFDVKFSTGVEELIVSATQLEAVFPNPANSITCIPVESETATKATIEVLDILGQTVETVFSGTLPAGPSKHFINAAQYRSGAYMVRLTTESGSIQVQRLVVR